MIQTDERNKLTTLFTCLQKEMECNLKKSNIAHDHSGTKGDCSEVNWIDWLKNYLPKRYSVTKGFVIDHTGNQSDQIDLIIYDKQYTPFVFTDKEAIYVPAESVYAVFEVKQTVNKEFIIYAGKKAESVRNLHRTSAPIRHVEGTAKPKELHNIIAGILTTKSDWCEDSNMLEEHLNNLDDKQFLNIGCIIENSAFYFNEEQNKYIKSYKEDSLMYFFFKLLVMLQKIGTVPAIEWDKYATCIKNF